MAAVVVAQGLENMLANAVQANAASYPAFAGLFTNDWNPSTSDTIADYDELVASWYAQIALGGYTVPVFSDPHATMSAASVSWMNPVGSAGPVTVYGYFVVHADGSLAWAERDPSAPIIIHDTNESYSVIIDLSLRNE